MVTCGTAHAAEANINKAPLAIAVFVVDIGQAPAKCVSWRYRTTNFRSFGIAAHLVLTTRYTSYQMVRSAT